ncbi:MAG: FTR1 family iron permease [Candidatus Accumulibacter sp.]|jgi:high-affinity iron transporter|nr:FTR1 family iron permease [Accumulibacter sp.]
MTTFPFLTRKFMFVIVMTIAVLCAALPVSSPAAAKKYADWNEIAGEMAVLLDESYEAYFRKDVEQAKNLVNDAYFGFYEKEGFERTVMTYISGKRGAHVEYQFPLIKKLMTEGAPNKEVRAALDYLAKMLREDANQLDGKQESGLGVFIAALSIILREGVEAILVIAAMAAYLTRSGNDALVRTVYYSAGAAILASVAAAFAMQQVLQTSGADQEIIEGCTMLLATVVLFFVSNWMFSKAEAVAWKGYIEGKVRGAVETGSGFALGAAAFLAVFREGAETILFYQAMLSDVQSNTGMVWAGFGVGCVALVGVFALIRYGSLKLPLKPFFIGTSILMYLMAIAFAGGGIKELQEGDVIGVTPVGFVQSIDLLGVYPTVETLLPQAVLVLLALGSVAYYRKKSRLSRPV